MGDADLAGRPPTSDPVGGPDPASLGPGGRGPITAGSQEHGANRRAPLDQASFPDATSARDAPGQGAPAHDEPAAVAQARLGRDAAAARAEMDGAIDEAIGRRDEAARAARQHRSDRWGGATGSVAAPTDGPTVDDVDPADHAIGPIDLRDGTGPAGDEPAPAEGEPGLVGASPVSIDDVGDDAAFDRFWSEVVGERPARHRLRRWVDRAVP